MRSEKITEFGRDSFGSGTSFSVNSLIFNEVRIVFDLAALNVRP